MIFADEDGELSVLKKNQTYKKIKSNTNWQFLGVDYMSNMWIKSDYTCEIYSMEGELLKIVYLSRVAFNEINNLSNQTNKFIAYVPDRGYYVYTFSEDYVMRTHMKLHLGGFPNMYFIIADCYAYLHADTLIMKRLSTNETVVNLSNVSDLRRIGADHFIIRKSDNESFVLNHKEIVKKIQKNEEEAYKNLRVVKIGETDELVFWSSNFNEVVIY